MAGFSILRVIKGAAKEPKLTPGEMALKKLQTYIKTQEPQIVRWLHGTWRNQQQAISYQEIRDAILNGNMSEGYLKDWQKDYAALVNEKLSPAWIDAMEAAAEDVKQKHPEFIFDPMWSSTQRWIADHGSQLVVDTTYTQKEALNHMIQKAATMGELGPDELSRVIRPLVGMVPREAAAVMNYYNAIRKDGMGIKDAQQKAARYGERVHRHRAMRIARTEIAFAYNRGMHDAVKQAQVEGYMPPVEKIWCTAEDERTCLVCGALEGQQVGQDDKFEMGGTTEKFPGMHQLPPAHPHCRCTVIYEEIPGALKSPGQAQQQDVEELEAPAQMAPAPNESEQTEPPDGSYAVTNIMGSSFKSALDDPDVAGSFMAIAEKQMANFPKEWLDDINIYEWDEAQSKKLWDVYMNTPIHFDITDGQAEALIKATGNEYGIIEYKGSYFDPYMAANGLDKDPDIVNEIDHYLKNIAEKSGIKPRKVKGSPKPEPVPEPDPVIPTHVPDDIMPGMDKLKYSGSGQYLGGAGKKDIYEGPNGEQYIYKPAQSKSGIKEDFRAHVQEGAAKVQQIVDRDTAVPVKAVTQNGQMGLLQPKIATSHESMVGFQNAAHNGEPLDPDMVKQFQREHVTDWLTGNFDAHGGNFVVDTNGRLRGVDKEQSFRYMSDQGSHKMSTDYHPNSYYGEAEPIYNNIYRRFAEGTIDMDLQEVLPYLKRVEAIPNKEYREIFRAYAEGLKGKGAAAENLLNDITTRKTNLRETYREFYGDMLTRRNGKKTKFIFADEGDDAAKQPLAARIVSEDALHKLPLADIKQIAKGQKIPYYLHMNKTELVSAISQPDTIKDMSAAARLRLQNAAAIRAGKEPAPARMPTPPDIMRADEIFQDFSKINNAAVGHSVISDTGSVEGLQVTARKITIENSRGAQTDYYEITGKLTNEKWQALSKTTAYKTADQDKLTFEAGSIEYDKMKAMYKDNPMSMSGADVATRRFADRNFELQVVDKTDYRGWHGFFRMRVKASGDPKKDAQLARELLGNMGVGEIAKAPGEKEMLQLKKLRALWQHAPTKLNQLNQMSDKATKEQFMADYLDELGYDDKRLNGMKMKRIFEGYSTIVDEGAATEYKKLGAEYMWAGIGHKDGVIGALRGPGLMSTNMRCKMGMPEYGKSQSSDMRVGGSDSVFVRLANRNAIKHNAPYWGSFAHGNYQIHIDVKQMERTDWYAYASDSFGSTEPGKFDRRPTAKEFVEGQMRYYSDSNEMMFRNGIPKESFTGITCQDGYARTQLINELQYQGITEVNGVSLEKFITLKENL